MTWWNFSSNAIRFDGFSDFIPADSYVAPATITGTRFDFENMNYRREQREDGVYLVWDG